MKRHLTAGILEGRNRGICAIKGMLREVKRDDEERIGISKDEEIQLRAKVNTAGWM